MAQPADLLGLLFAEGSPADRAKSVGALGSVESQPGGLAAGHHQRGDASFRESLAAALGCPIGRCRVSTVGG